MEGFCKLPDNLILDATLSKWTKRTVSFAILGALPGVTVEEQELAVRTACAFWPAVSGIELVFTTNARTADIRMGSGVIDRSGGTLAWSELPNGADGPIKQQYDTKDKWSPALTRAGLSPGFIPLVVTCAHEVGHAIGLGHSRDPQALMFPSLNIEAWKPQADDIREAQLRYGPPVPGQPPPPPAGSLNAVQALAEIAAIMSRYNRAA